MLWAAAAGHPSAARADQTDAGHPPCTLLYNGGGTLTDNEKVNGVWTEADQRVNDGVNSGLAASGFDIRYYIARAQGSQARLAEVVAQLKETKCAKVIQVTRTLGGSPGTKFFSYAVLVIHLDEKRIGAGTSYTVAGDYSKDYKYPMTEEVLRTLSLSGVGKQIAADIDASKVLADMKSAPAPTPGT